MAPPAYCLLNASLEVLGRDPVKLCDHKGESPAVLLFMASYCGPSRLAARELERSLGDRGGKLLIYGICAEENDKAIRAVLPESGRIIAVRDPENRLSQVAQVLVFPTAFLVDVNDNILGPFDPRLREFKTALDDMVDG
jgi:hypothetical protein